MGFEEGGVNPKVLPWITSCWRVHRVHPFLTLCARRLQDQAKQIKELKEHLSSNEHVKAPSETQASSTSERSWRHSDSSSSSPSISMVNMAFTSCLEHRAGVEPAWRGAVRP